MHSHEFSLPQGTIAFSRALPAHICTLVTGGRPPAAATTWYRPAAAGQEVRGAGEKFLSLFCCFFF